MDLLGGHRGLGVGLDIGPGALVLVPAGVRLIFQGNDTGGLHCDSDHPNITDMRVL